MIFGGDFRQVLPVVKRGSMRDQIAASISRSSFWNSVKILYLQQNMRSAHDIEFSQFLLRVGDVLEDTAIDVYEINEMLIIKFFGEEKLYTSWDSVKDDNNNLFQKELLNSLCPSGLPPHRITLKVGCPIMLLRNVALELGHAMEQD
ncbi:uncharacterized protein [Henckelia pumila]|uniref:uncharacterized protein n=1 Tax=Henckelia pumila TaxID=405737 RepID=UPI003C6DE46B